MPKVTPHLVDFGSYVDNQARARVAKGPANVAVSVPIDEHAARPPKMAHQPNPSRCLGAAQSIPQFPANALDNAKDVLVIRDLACDQVNDGRFDGVSLKATGAGAG
jgi:hypothetical protein